MKAILTAHVLLLVCLAHGIGLGASPVNVQPLVKQTEATPQTTKVLIDTDMGWDDILSILYLLKKTDIEIVGVLVTGCGETNLRWGKIIALSLMEYAGRPNIPIAVGAEKPLAFAHVFPKLFRYDMNDMMGYLGSLSDDDSVCLDPRPAWRFLADTLDQATEPIVILSLGGLTNIGRMLQEYPNAKLDKIKQIYAMGGAVYVDGNVALLNNARKEWDQGPRYASNYKAEWNIFVDPVAAKLVFDSMIPLTLVPLDACNEVLLSPTAVEAITADDNLASLAKKILQVKTGTHNEGIPVPIFDPLATMVMAGGLPEYAYASLYLDVDVSDAELDNRSGRTFPVDKGSRKINAVLGVSATQFAKEYKEVMNR